MRRNAARTERRHAARRDGSRRHAVGRERENGGRSTDDLLDRRIEDAKLSVRDHASLPHDDLRHEQAHESRRSLAVACVCLVASHSQI